MKTTIVILFVFCSISATGQHNFIGKTQTCIEDYYQNNANYYLKIDTLTQDNVLLTFKSLFQYPYYTYEIDLGTDNCISYGVVSKNTNVLDAYFDILSFAGNLIRKDTINHNKIYELKQGNILRFYDIKQPYLDDNNVNRRSLFYILVREKRLDLGDY